MSVSLVVIRLEVTNTANAVDLNFTGLKSKCWKEKDKSGLSEWPPLVSEKLLAIHRGQRIPVDLSIITLDEKYLNTWYSKLQEMAFCNTKDAHRDSDMRAVESLSNAISIASHSSKESTPGASTSKEGTPGANEDGCRKMRPVKEHVPFICGNPMVDVTQGILHLYKENSMTSLGDAETRSEMLCMLAVPTSMTVRDLLQFTAPFCSQIQRLCIIRDSTPNQYMVLIKFRAQADADTFYKSFNGLPYNSIEPDICHLVYVARVETTKESENGGLPIPGHTELPTCPVCLERMDESVDGILTILCNHSFHGECLAKWSDTSCPVCRFCQTPEELPDQRCLFCGSSESLWICLICGHVGCGRYVGGHAYSHFLDTNHIFSLQVGNSRVWDYVRDNYVHRLLQSEGDGKVVSYERSSPVVDTKEDVYEGEEKLTALQLEYTYLLSSQLESQRTFFEARIVEAKAEAVKEAEQYKELSVKLREQLDNVSSDLSAATKEKGQQDKKLQTLSTKFSKVAHELQTEQELNISLRQGKTELEASLEQLKCRLKEKEDVIKDLESQVSDIMMHLEAQSTVRQNPELVGGKIELPPAPPPAPNKTKGSRRHKH